MTNDNNNAPVSISSAAVVERSLMAFGAGMTLQSRTDAKNSFLFATLVANNLHDQTTLSESWFATFLQVMGDCGWVTAHRTYEQERNSDHALTLANVAVKAVTAAASGLLQGGPVAQALSLLAQQAIDGLGSSDQALNLFKRQVQQRNQVVVGLASCIETSAGEVVMALGAVQRSVRREDLDVLVFDWHSDTSETYKSTAALSFNSQVYDAVREGVEQRLGERARKRIMDYRI